MDITYNDFNAICRLCLTKNDISTDLFQENVQFLDNFGVHIKVNKWDELPQKICCHCENKIVSIFTFVSQCKTNYAILNSILIHEKKTKSKIKISGDISCNNYSECEQEIDMYSKTKGQDTNVILGNNWLEGKKEDFSFATKVPKKYEIEKPEITCKNCNLAFISKISLSTHYMNKVECRPISFKVYKCEHCDKEFLCLRDKIDHENVHTGETPYTCPFCAKQFKFRTNWHKHICRHKTKLNSVKNKGAYTEKRVRLKLKCDKCEKVFASRSGFQHHKLRHEGKVKKKSAVKVDKNVRHFLCNYCAMTFYIKANLDAHLRVHTGERPYKCNQCDQQFKQKSVLDRHTLNHLDVRPKPFVCDLCEKSFTTKAHMEIHRRLHTGEKPYECHFCQKSFNYKTRWRIHLRMHTGESPFVCGICNNSYHDKGSLKKHQRKKGHKEDPNI